MTQWQTVRARVGVDRKRIEHLQQVVDDTRLLMRHGNINYLQVLTARQSLLSAQLELLADRKAEIQSVIDLITRWAAVNSVSIDAVSKTVTGELFCEFNNTSAIALHRRARQNHDFQNLELRANPVPSASCASV